MFLLRAQRPSGGWDYTERPGQRSDISVTAWQVAALRSARLAGVASPEVDAKIDKILEGAVRYVHSLTDPNTLETGYESRPDPKAKIKHPTLGPTAMSLACREAILSSVGPESELLRSRGLKPALLKRQAAVLLREENLPRWKPAWAGGGGREENHVYYYWYHGTMGMRNAEGKTWKTWNGAVTKALLQAQTNDGSWPKVGRWAPDGGRVYVTAIAVLTLQAAYRYP